MFLFPSLICAELCKNWVALEWETQVRRTKHIWCNAQRGMKWLGRSEKESYAHMSLAKISENIILINRHYCIWQANWMGPEARPARWIQKYTVVVGPESWLRQSRTMIRFIETILGAVVCHWAENIPQRHAIHVLHRPCHAETNIESIRWNGNANSLAPTIVEVELWHGS